MAAHYYALCTTLEPAWHERLGRELVACDWSISAEWAGIDDDAEAAALVRPLARAKPVSVGADVVVDFGDVGLLRVQAMDAAACETLRAENGGPDDDCKQGLCFSIEGASGTASIRIVGQAVQGIAIGMAGARGWVLVPSGKWWNVAKRAWVSPRSSRARK